MKKPVRTIPTIVGLLVVAGGLVASLILVGDPTRWWTHADTDARPVEIRVTDITDNGFVVSWITNTAATGWVQGPTFVVSDDRDQSRGDFGRYLTHLVSVGNLKPNTAYILRVGSGRTLGQEFVVKTGPKLAAKRADIVYGQVITAGGDPAEGAIVYVAMPGSMPQAVLVKPSGSWVVPLAQARTLDGKSLTKYNAKTQLSILVQGGGMGRAEAYIAVGMGNPVPVVKLTPVAGAVVP